MLISLEVTNFALIQARLKIEFAAGFSCITGESGSGKSMLLDALEVTLAQRKIRGNELKPGCELVANFKIDYLPLAQQWLTQHQMLADPTDEVIIRRYWSKDKVARSSINDHPCTQNSIKELGGLLMKIYTQHQCQQLLDPKQQLAWLDLFAQDQQQLQAVQNCYHAWQQLQTQQQTLLANLPNESKLAFINFQLQELQSVDLTRQHLQDLQQQRRAGAQRQQLLTLLASLEDYLGGDSLALNHSVGDGRAQGGDGILTQLHQVQMLLTNWHYQPDLSAELSPLLEEARIQLAEAAQRVAQWIKTISQTDEVDEQQLETELSHLYQLARKYHVEPEQLATYYHNLEQERTELLQTRERLAKLQQESNAAQQRYQQLAAQLSAKRQRGAAKLAIEINHALHQLGMEYAQFTIQLLPVEPADRSAQPSIAAPPSPRPNPNGAETACFCLNANLSGQLRPLSEIASGGELSRVNLVLQAIIGQYMVIPTMFFDETDSGVSGVTAEVVATLLRKLGDSAQVICITHLAQVALQAQQHYLVRKLQDPTSTCPTLIQIQQLNPLQRQSELARLLAGSKASALTIAQVQELLNANRSAPNKSRSFANKLNNT